MVDESKGFLELSGDQWVKLLDILNVSKAGRVERLSSKTTSNEWIVDLRDANLFPDVWELTPCLVGLPNGKKKVALKEEKLC